ncbi:MAG TPA: hypothetical protein VM364_00490 [Vicinamibacterales bacterium]|nr:hypothetical protein [Vicinamibacterales bacterium]
MSDLFEAVPPRPRSRIHGCRRILSELRRLLGKTRRAAEYRAHSDVEQRWTARVGDALDQLIREGDLVLPGGDDPRDRRRVRKRQVKMF